MEQLDDVTRNELLAKALSEAQGDVDRLNSERQGLDVQISVSKTRLAQLRESVMAEEVRTKESIRSLQESVQREAQELMTKNDGLLADIARVTSDRIKAEHEAKQSLSVLDSRITERRDALSKLTDQCSRHESALREARQRISAIRQAIEGL